MNTAVLPEIAESLAEMLALRHRIHAQPELAYEEIATGDLVTEQLEAWGYGVHRGLGRTGVVATLKKGNGGKSIGVRADMEHCRSMSRPVSHTPARSPARCTPAVTTGTLPRCCRRHATWRRKASSTAR
jgi:hypothetical protein